MKRKLSAFLAVLFAISSFAGLSACVEVSNKNWKEAIVLTGLTEFSSVSELDFSLLNEIDKEEAIAKTALFSGNIMLKYMRTEENQTISGKEAAYLILSSVELNADLTIDNAAALFVKLFKETAEAKAALKEEKLTVGSFYAMIYSMLISNDSSGEQIGNRLVLNKTVSEETALKSGIADGYFAKRFEALKKELSLLNQNGIVSVNLTKTKKQAMT